MMTIAGQHYATKRGSACVMELPGQQSAMHAAQWPSRSQSVIASFTLPRPPSRISCDQDPKSSYIR
eukprot:scaffold172768_cov20-Prasinocladus_malaysianus.AAC.1